MTTHGDPQRPGPVGPDGDVPRLPRGRGLRLARPDLMRIAMLAIVLVFLMMTQRRCANAVSGFVASFDDQGSASQSAAGSAKPPLRKVDASGSAGSGASTTASKAAGSGAAPGSAAAAASSPAQGARGLDGYEQLRPGMTEAEIKAAIERARARAADRTSGP